MSSNRGEKVLNSIGIWWTQDLRMQHILIISLKGNKGQNQNLTHVLIGKIQVTFIKYVLYPDKVILEISPFKVGIRSLGWDHRGHYPDKRS